MRRCGLLWLVLSSIFSFAQYGNNFPGQVNGNNIWGGNQVFTSLQNICIADQQVGADSGAKVNACLAKLPLAGTTRGGEVWITQSGTISTQILINNLSYVTVRCIGADASIQLTNGITGNPAEPAIKISGTSSYVNIVGCEIQGNGLTGASGNGHGISVIGTGATPADINIINTYIAFNKGNGKNGTGGSMLAAGVYGYNAIDIRIIEDSSLQANNYGAFFETNANNFEVAGSEIVGNLNDGIVAKGSASGWVERNDCEQNGSGGATDACVWIDGMINAHIERNHIEANNRRQLSITNGVDHSRGITFAGNYGIINFAAGIGIDTPGGVDMKMYANSFIGGPLCTSCRMLDVADGFNWGRIRFFDNNWRQLTGGTTVDMVLIRGTTTGTNGGTLEGNRCGSQVSSGDGTITTCYELQSPSSGWHIANNGCITNTGATIGTCILLNTGAASNVVEDNFFTVLGGTLTTQITDNAANQTIFIGLNGTTRQNVGGQIYSLTADQTITAGASLTTIPGLSWTLAANLAYSYSFSCHLMYSQATAAASDSFGVQDVTVAPTNIAAKAQANISSSTFTAGNLPTLATTTATAIVTFTPSASATVFNADIDGFIEQPSNASSSVFNVMGQFTTNNGTIKRGSFCRVF